MWTIWVLFRLDQARSHNRVLAVFDIEMYRIHRNSFLCCAEKAKSSNVPPYLPSHRVSSDDLPLYHNGSRWDKLGAVVEFEYFIIYPLSTEFMAIYIAIINSCVHMVMYSYYFFSSFQNKKLLEIMKHIKPFITVMQLVQFIIIIAHLIVAILPSCGMSYFFHLQLINFIVLTVLFGQFFMQTYIKKEQAPKSNYTVAQT